MSRVFIIGISGGVGSRLVPKLIEDGHQVSGLIRKPEHEAELNEAGATTVTGDLMEMSLERLTEITAGFDILVFSAGAAGSGLNRTTIVDYKTPVKLIKAARNNGIARIYLVSAIMDCLRSQETSRGFEHYMKMKRGGMRRKGNRG